MYNAMGPILQEQTASKKVPAKERLRMKNAENAGVAASNNKRGVNVNQNRKPLKKDVPLQTGQVSDPLPKTENAQNGIKPKKAKTLTAGPRKLRSMQGESELRPSHPQHGPERQKNQTDASSCRELAQRHVALERSRRALSLPLAPQPVLQQLALQKHAPDLESLRLLDHKEDDTDSASDLSDSERLPVLPSPCTPPQLNLRAEIINSMDLQPDIPGPSRADIEDASYSYPDFLPPPFNSWSLRQLAIFLNTEGKRAPRPKPVGELEKYLERLLKLEWHQIQTIQAESGRHAVPSIRNRVQTSGFQPNSTRPRPHTAPPTRLNSPKSFQQGQRVFSSLGSPSSTQVSRPVCPHCHMRYLLCNGACTSYAYQRHSRLSPLLERKSPPVNTQKRSNSESRASETHSTTKNQHAVSPQAAKAQQNHMQAPGNARRPTNDLNTGKCLSSGRNGNGVRSSETDKKKETPGAKSGGCEKRINVPLKRDGGGSGKKLVKDGARPEVIGRPGIKRGTTETCKGKMTSAAKTFSS
ncbi:hypothetical protein DNTS_008534 [Danionella cerebrum]|uniref:Uncharacterized protein n=1 Tax=Danionella cerebrum TaxID=2873325 RepID=A0A553QY00_9TELE|nr:hypothetical protein DNTS_008534 [Danionella translucida]